MAKLVYFNGRGLSECVRIILTVTDTEYTEEDLTEREHFLKLIDDDQLLFHQVPLLLIDGLQLVQSGSIARYLGRRGNIAGNNDVERARCDMMYEGAKEFQRAFVSQGFVPEDQYIKGCEKNMKKYLPIFEKIVKEKSGKFLVNDGLTIADCALYEAIHAMEDYRDSKFKDFGEEARLGSYPALEAYYEGVRKEPGIAKYEASIRKPLNTPEYCKEVAKVLNYLQ